MIDPIKLTPAQRRELVEMAGRDYRSHYADGYSPVARLLALGLVERADGRYSPTYAITDAGRQALLAAHA